MTCAFTIALPGEPAELFPIARQAVVQRGGRIEGGATRGTAYLATPVGEVVLSYRIASGGVAVTVIDKPMLVSCERIESELRAAIMGAVPRARSPAPTDAGVPDAGPPEPLVILDAIDESSPEAASRSLAAHLSEPGANFGSPDNPSELVARYQDLVGLHPDGIVGDDTRRAAAYYGVTLPRRPGVAQPVAQAPTVINATPLLLTLAALLVVSAVVAVRKR